MIGDTVTSTIDKTTWLLIRNEPETIKKLLLIPNGTKNAKNVTYIYNTFILRSVDNVPLIPTHLCKLVDDKGSLLQPTVNWPRPPPTCCWGSSDLLLAGRLVGWLFVRSPLHFYTLCLPGRREHSGEKPPKSPPEWHTVEKSPTNISQKWLTKTWGWLGYPDWKLLNKYCIHDTIPKNWLFCVTLFTLNHPETWIQMDEYLKPNMLIAQNYPGWLGGVHPSGAGWREGWSQHIGSVEPNGGTSIAFTQLWTHLLRRTDGRRLPINWRRIEPSLTQLSFPPPSFPVETSRPCFPAESFNTRCISVLIVSSPITRQWMVNYQVIPSEPSVN